MKPIVAIATLAASLIFAPLAGAQEDKPKEDPKQVLFTNVRIFDGVNEKLIEGDVDMVQNNILVDDDIEDGERLACQALPLTDAVTVSFDDL